MITIQLLQFIQDLDSTCTRTHRETTDHTMECRYLDENAEPFYLNIDSKWRTVTVTKNFNNHTENFESEDFSELYAVAEIEYVFEMPY